MADGGAAKEVPKTKAHTDKDALGDMDASVHSTANMADFMPKEKLKELIKKRSDTQGLLQLSFHMGCVFASAYIVHISRQTGSWLLFIIGQLCFGLVASFYFNGFHECIHGTAFKTKLLNTIVSHAFGFACFRGARWYWYFHWAHHRFTNNPELDPELSGSTVDRADPLAGKGVAAIKAYMLFLSGYPFGFERLPGVFLHAAGNPPSEPTFVKTDKARAAIQGEYRAWVVLYTVLLVASIVRPSFGVDLWFYWLLPHMLGSAHLRYYQTAEHRSCANPGHTHTDTTAWVVSRTTTTWWLYCKLAWNMPFHAEHHAWPNVPFHLLPSVHESIKKSLGGKLPPSGCTPDGKSGYMGVHFDILKNILGLQA